MPPCCLANLSIKPDGWCATALLAAALSLPFSAAAAETEQYHGVVVKADPATQSVVVKNAQTGGRFRFLVTPNTAISRNNQPITLADITPGAEITVDYVRVEEKYEAQRIVILAAGASP
jgi:hypothetical protein